MPAAGAQDEEKPTIKQIMAKLHKGAKAPLKAVQAEMAGLAADGIVKQLNLQFVLAYTADEFAASLHHIAEGRIDVTPLITGRVGLDGVKGAFADLANPERHAKIMVEPFA